MPHTATSATVLARMCLLVVFLMSAARLGADPAPRLRVMPLGDSITAGSYGAGLDGIGGYRRFLAARLAKAGLPVTFVGSLDDPKDPTFDTRHEGHRAWRANSLAASAPGWMVSTQPDLVLVQAGVNDLIQGARPEIVAVRIETLVKAVLGASPRVRVLLAGILNVREGNLYKVRGEDVTAVNRLLPPMVERLRAGGYDVRYVDLPGLAALGKDDFGSDGLHPNDSGYAKMAEAWFGIVGPILGTSRG